MREDVAKCFCEIEQARLLTLKADDAMDRHGNKVAKDLGLPWGTVSRWVEQDAADSGDNPGILTTVERQELTALRKQVRVLTMERDILKKATAYFAKLSE